MNLFGITIPAPFDTILGALVKAIIWIVALLTLFAYVQLIERRVIARIQVRIGPNRAGPFGLLQPIADALKAIFKEELIPAQADRVLFVLAPIVSVTAALSAFAVVPLGPSFDLFGARVDLYIADVNIGLLYLLAVASLSVYGIVLAGWSSSNKYSMMGGLRSAAQLISYEISLGLSLVGVLMISGSLSLQKTVEQQGNIWFVFLQPLGFILYVISAFAETNRLPFDLPEAETELVAGYYTEYSSIKMAFFFMAEYINIVTVSAVASTLFLGGWQGPFGWLPGPWWLALKIAIVIFVFMWVRGTLPRFRYDQLMNFGWKFMFPMALINVAFAAAVILLFPSVLPALQVLPK